MDVYDNTVIYILTLESAGLETVHSCHQLCYKLRRFRYNAKLFIPLASGGNFEANPDFAKYGCEVASSLGDDPRNILIVPETATQLLYKFQRIRKAIWWLSVNNYYSVVFRIASWENPNFFNIISPYNCFHFTASFYAKKHLELFSIPKSQIAPLEPYVNSALVLKSNIQFKKQDFVAYNAKIVSRFLAGVLSFFKEEKYSHIKFVPVADNMPVNLRADVFKLSKVFFDFGDFAGRESTSQEAALFEACVITGKTGAAAYIQDTPIPEKYKFGYEPENVAAAAKSILDCVNNYEKNIGDFTEYKNFSKGLEGQFEKNIKDIFVKVKEL
ncbi:MAG: hypothetical protein LBS21_16600 [Clostridiales bacterium]|jgi:hypothetical protein|nr:hypothetical protein [Clostridiales bacterium]